MPSVRSEAAAHSSATRGTGQLLDRQLHALTAAGCQKIFADKKFGKNAEREELWRCLEYLRPGDTLVAPALDRLGRSCKASSRSSPVCKRGIGFRSLDEALDTTTRRPVGLRVFAALGVVHPRADRRRHRRGPGRRPSRATPPPDTEQIRQARAIPPPGGGGVLGYAAGRCLAAPPTSTSLPRPTFAMPLPYARSWPPCNTGAVAW